MTVHFPALIIVVPLVAAFVVTIAGWIDKRWCFPLTAMVTTKAATSGTTMMRAGK